MNSTFKIHYEHITVMANILESVILLYVHIYFICILIHVHYMLFSRLSGYESFTTAIKYKPPSWQFNISCASQLNLRLTGEHFPQSLRILNFADCSHKEENNICF